MTESFSPCRGMIGGNAVFKDRVWLLGGGRYETPAHPQYTYLNDVWSSADGKAWERHLEHAPWRGRVYHDVAVFDDRLWVMEGQVSQGKNVKDVWYSSDGQDWYAVPQTPWKERHASSVFAWYVSGTKDRGPQAVHFGTSVSFRTFRALSTTTPLSTDLDAYRLIREGYSRDERR